MARQPFEYPSDQPVEHTLAHRCLYKRVITHKIRGELTKCEACHGYDTECSQYESRRAFTDWVNRRGME